MKLSNFQKEQLQKLILNGHLILQEVLNVVAGNKLSLLIAVEKKEIKIIKDTFPELSVVFCEDSINPSEKIYKKYISCVLSRSPKVANELAKLILMGEEYKGNRGEKIGELLGYPDCCIKQLPETDNNDPGDSIYKIFRNSKKISFFNNNLFNFSTRLRSNKNDFEGFRKYITLNKSLWPLPLNNLQLISHIPCSYDCKESLSIGKKTYQLLSEYDFQLANQIKDILSKPVLFFDILKWIIFDGEVKDDKELEYKKIILPISLVNSKLMKKISEGNKILINKKHIKIFKNKNLIFSYQKKNEKDGFLLNFSKES